MGLRRLDVTSHYSAEELAKVKKKKDRQPVKTKQVKRS